MKLNWGERYYDHFTKFLGPVRSRAVYRQSIDSPDVQILEYDNVFDGCRVFTSFGLSHYSDQIGQICEVMVPVDSGWENVSNILANTLFYMIQQDICMSRSAAVSGVDAICHEFAQKYGKHALYFTDPFGLPEEFRRVQSSNDCGSVYLGIFISQFEYNFLLREGFELFEELLETSNVDPYNISRRSIV